MINALKKMDKKILIIASVIILLPVLLIIFLAIIQGCSNSKITYEKYEEKMISAMKEYVEKNDKTPNKEGEFVTIELSDLVDDNYIGSSEDLLGDSTCKGIVTVRRNGAVIEENDGGYLNYTVSLECDNYKTETLRDSLLKQVVTTGNGLYQQEDGYIFKGDNVNNYITFYDKNYRIIGMDTNGIIKLLNVDIISETEYWDDKYNTEVEDYSGKNIYSDSYILKRLLEDYNNNDIISKDQRKKIITQDICIDSRSKTDKSLNFKVSCENVLENQVVSLMNVLDYANASLDLECNSIDSMSCNNYNYLQELNLRTWTLNSVIDNTYEVYFIGGGVVRSQKASKYFNYNMIIYIDGNEKIIGEGKQNDPYTIK